MILLFQRSHTLGSYKNITLSVRGHDCGLLYKTIARKAFYEAEGYDLEYIIRI